VPKYGNDSTKCYAVKAARKQLTVTIGGPQRQLHGDDSKSSIGNQTHIQSF